MKFFKVEDGKTTLICAEDMRHAAHKAANLSDCCFSDFEWDCCDPNHWFTTKYGNIDVRAIEIDEVRLFKEYLDSDILQQLLDKKTEAEYECLDSQAALSKDKESFKKGVYWLRDHINEYLESNEKSMNVGEFNYFLAKYRINEK